MGQTIGSVLDPSRDDQPTMGKRAAQIGTGAGLGALRSLAPQRQPMQRQPFTPGQPMMDDSQSGQQPTYQGAGMPARKQPFGSFYGMQ